MTAILLLIPTGCYFLAAILYAKQGNWGLCITYSGYSAANIGLLIVDRIMAK